MKYENADNIFPSELIDEIRKYFPEGYVYISHSAKQCEWGSISGQRLTLNKRNEGILIEYQEGKSVSKIAEERYLSQVQFIKFSENLLSKMKPFLVSIRRDGFLLFSI